MKKFRVVMTVAVLTVGFIAGMALAGDKVHIVNSGVYSGAVSRATSPALFGYIEKIRIPIPTTMATWTGLVTIVTSTNSGSEIVYSNTITADTVCRPCVARCTTTGISTTTNFSPFYMYDDTLITTFTVTSTGMVSEVVDTTIWSSDK